MSPSVVSSDVTFKLPSADGSSGNTLSTDGSGNMSWKNNNIGVRVHLAADHAALTTGTATDITFDTTDWNNGITIGSYKTFTVGTAGKYVIGLTVTFDQSGNTTGTRRAWITVNSTSGQITGFVLPPASSSTGTTDTCTSVYNFSANDVVTCRAYQSSGGSVALLAMTGSTGVAGCSFFMQKIN